MAFVSGMMVVGAIGFALIGLAFIIGLTLTVIGIVLLVRNHQKQQKKAAPILLLSFGIPLVVLPMIAVTFLAFTVFMGIATC